MKSDPDNGDTRSVTTTAPPAHAGSSHRCHAVAGRIFMRGECDFRPSRRGKLDSGRGSCQAAAYRDVDVRGRQNHGSVR